MYIEADDLLPVWDNKTWHAYQLSVLTTTKKYDNLLLVTRSLAKLARHYCIHTLATSCITTMIKKISHLANYFHLDLPTIVSGNSIGFFEPRCKIWENRGKRKPLSELRLSNPNHLLPFVGIGDFDVSSDDYPKTLFRFPLRRNRSRICKDTYTPDVVYDLMRVLKEEVRYLLLFLRSLEQIKAYKITKEGEKLLLFKVEICKSEKNAESADDFRRNRSIYKKKLKDVYDRDKQYGIVEDIFHTSTFSINITTREKGAEKKESTRWLVSNLVGSKCHDVRAAAKEVRNFPTIGTAMEVGPGAQTGNRIFCFLPLPPRIHTNLPVHVHGTFSLQTDRRDLLWPGLEQQDDVKTKWNELLIEKVLPVCYEKMLTRALEINRNHPELFYQAIPNPLEVKYTNWSSLLRPLYYAIFSKLNCFCSKSQKWVELKDATFVPELTTSVERGIYNISENSPSNTIPDVVYKVMKVNYDLVEVPGFIWRALEYAQLDTTLNKLSPCIVRKELKNNRLKYYSRSEKLKLLSYCLSDCDCYSDLIGIWLVPLANKSFECFDAYEPPLYVCTEECSVELLPKGHEFIVNVPGDAQLQNNLQKVASSPQKTQLRLLNPHSVSTLLATKCFANVPRTILEVTLEQLGCSLSWLELFWNWVKRQDLRLFENLFIVPVQTETDFKLRRLARQGGIICVEQSHGTYSGIAEILKKFGVACIMQESTHYVQHQQLYRYFQRLTCKGALEAIKEANHYDPARVQNVSLSFDEASHFQSFIATDISPMIRDIVSHLPIFCSASDPYNPMPVCSGEFIYEPEGNTIALKCFPSNFTILSRTRNIEKLVRVCHGVKFPPTLVELIGTNVFPLIHEGTFTPLTSLSDFMREVFNIFLVLKSQKKSFASSLESLPFLFSSDDVTRRCSTEVFDPHNKLLQILYSGKDVFPLSPFNEETYIPHLRECGLKTMVTVQDIYDILVDISKGPGIHKTSAVDFSKSIQVMKFLKENESMLCEYVEINTGYFGKWDKLGNAICSLAQEKAIFAVQCSPCSDYPSCLRWKGSEFFSHFTSVDNATMPYCGDSNKELHFIMGSEVYFVECPPSLLGMMKPKPPLQQVISHFMRVIGVKDQMSPDELTAISMKVYNYLQIHISFCRAVLTDLTNKRWIWVEDCYEFLAPSRVSFMKHASFHHSLAPYYHLLPKRYDKFKELFKQCGCHVQITDLDLVSILKKAKDDKSSEVAVRWTLVSHILNWITADGTAHASKREFPLDQIYVPIESETSDLLLEKVSNVTYTDLKYLKTFAQCKHKALKFIHSKVERLSKYLGVQPMSKELGISEDAFEDAGPNESLVTRLRNILKEYQGDLTIVKELLQNADDAGATEVNICYDRRTHCENTDLLYFAGMARAHGPALVVHNNKMFSEDDFKNIQKLAGATKKDQPLKIGKFGLGFCSVYGITDIPSFISQNYFYIFDPTLQYLKDEIQDPRKPGKKVRFVEEIIQYSNQMDPYKDLFNFKPNESFNGTIFRLPFRERVGGIHDRCYKDEDVTKLIQKIKTSGPELLLFLPHLQLITFSIKDDHQLTRKLAIEKEVMKTLPHGATLYRIRLKANEKLVQNSYWLVTEQQSQEKFSSVACALSYDGRNYIPDPTTGKAFCFLSLELETGLPVHVNANFAVRNDRKDIHTSDSFFKNKECRYNLDLMCGVISQAYLLLIRALCDMCGNRTGYNFYTFWPLESELKRKNAWKDLVDSLYSLIPNQSLCYSKYADCWLKPSDCFILSAKILHKDQLTDVLAVVKLLQIKVIDLPQQYQHHLHVDNFSEENFIFEFFQKIKRIPVETRNNILYSLLYSYTVEPTKACEQCVLEKPCIPCQPNGKNIRKCKDTIDPDSKLSVLYEPKDGRFPLQSFMDPLIKTTLMKFGMIWSKLPWDLLVDRARTVKSMYNSDKTTALTRTTILLDCISKNVDNQELPQEAHAISQIPMFPVLQRPQYYPKCLLWAGTRKTLLCCDDLITDIGHGNQRMHLLVGSQKCIVSQETPTKGGCGKISDQVAKALKMNCHPKVDDVIQHLIHISECFSDADLKPGDLKYANSACEKIYSYLNDYMSHSKKQEHQFMQHFEDARYKLLWNGEKFVHSSFISSKWKLNGPYLYPIPPLMTSAPVLLGHLHIKETFDPEFLCRILKRIWMENSSNPISKDCAKVVVCISEDLTAGEAAGLEELERYLYDEQMYMRHIGDLVYNDAPWCKPEKKSYLIHHDFSKPVLDKIGVKFIRSEFFEQYAWKGVEFGQHEDLTQRIKNILDSYTYDETVLKELLQNADDAKAKKLYFIVDERSHGTSRVPSVDWKDLQGPALLVWNDKGFTEDDLTGIQKLGLGSKRTDAESIGRYGIGFNVVYHLTDCPSLYTNGNTLCIFDPHIRYIPRATKDRPGRIFHNVDEAFWKNMTDLQSPFLLVSPENCPKEILNRGSLFRFPLRYTHEMVKKSEIVSEDTKPLGASKLKQQLQEWAPKLKEALLFTKHVAELKFCAINDSRFEILQQFKAELEDHGVHEREKLFECTKEFQSCRKPMVVHYSVKLTESMPARDEEQWVVQQGIGDLNKLKQHWEYLDTVHPLHGIAAKIRGKSFIPKIFCYLPLPLSSNLPMHVNANFILDSSSRSSLWKSRDVENPDDKKKWNDRLILALGSSYAQFLVHCKEYIFRDSSYEKSKQKELKSDTDNYYNLFPKWLDVPIVPQGEMLDLAKTVYRILAEKKYEVLIFSTRNECKQKSGIVTTFSVKWKPPESVEAIDQAYYFKPSRESKDIPKALKAIGVNITAAPLFIMKHFESVSIDIPEASPENVWTFYEQHFDQASSSRKFPCHITKTNFKEIHLFKLFLKYLASNEEKVMVMDNEYEKEGDAKTIISFPHQPYNIPLLLTADGYIRNFAENSKVTCSEYSGLFPNMLDCFLHPDLLDLGLQESYFMRPDKKNCDFIIDIFSNTLSSSLREVKKFPKVHSVININNELKTLWECLTHDPVFSVHTKEIIKNWALILAKGSDCTFLFGSTHDCLMPVAPPKSLSSLFIRSAEETKELEKQHKIFQVLVNNYNMPTTHALVLKAWQYCPCMSDPSSILKNLYYLHKEEDFTFNDSDIRLLFKYFKDIHFQNDKQALSLVKSLPLFKNKDGKLCSMSEKAFIWPDKVCAEGLKKILPNIKTLFLDPEGDWVQLTTADTLGIERMSNLLFYINYIFPHFKSLSQAERLMQLEFIKRELFNKTEVLIKQEGYDEDYHLAIKFMTDLKSIPFFTKKGVLSPISGFCDPKHPLFKLFPSVYHFPPEDYCNDSWLPFFEKLGLQTIPTNKEFLSFCKGVSRGKVECTTDIRKVSRVLLNCLFKTQEWHGDEEFLNQVSSIPFVHTDEAAKLSWIVPPSNCNICYIKIKKSSIPLVCLKHSASMECAELLWTVCPVVFLPKVDCPPLMNYFERESKKKSFYKHLGICFEPDENQVIQNIETLSSKSHFSSFKLFEKYESVCICKRDKCTGLFEVMLKNLRYIKNKFEHASSRLVDTPCIPVGCSHGDSDSRPVLVKPLQVIACSVKELAPSLHPFLNALPEEMNDMISMLRNMKVHTQVRIDNVLNALSLIECHVRVPLDPNSVEAVNTLVQLLYSTLNSEKIEENAVLYLPDNNRKLVKSTNLLYDDKEYHKNVVYTLNECSYSVLSMLYPSGDLTRDCEFELKSLVSKLPPSHSPSLFSACVHSRLHQDCSQQHESSLAAFIEKALTSDIFPKIVGMLLVNHEENAETGEKFITCLKECLSELNVVTVDKLKVSITLAQTGTSIEIGAASMNFLLQDDENGTATLYIDSSATVARYHTLESFSAYFIEEIMKRASLEPNSLRSLLNIFPSLLRIANSEEDLKLFLKNEGLDASQILKDRKFDYTLKPRLGEPIPEDWIHRLQADLLNTFRPQELVGYEKRENFFVFARIEHKACQLFEEESMDAEIEKYVIRTIESNGENDTADQCTKTVPVIELYKILRIRMDQEPEVECKELKLYDPDNEFVINWEAEKDLELNDIYVMICDELKKIQKITNEDLKRKCLKAMYLKWHPDKNNHKLATKAFQFLQRQIDRMKRGLDLEDPEGSESASADYSSRYSNEWFTSWDNLFKERASSYQREQRTYQSSFRESREDWFGFSSSSEGISVSPDHSKAEVWKEQAQHDLSAMEAMFREASQNPRLSAHVCYLAHQLAEKSLKAGMYAKNGLHPNSLKHHDLLIHASALEQVDANASGLLVNACLLNDYYLKTRYPNQYIPQSVPSQEISLQDAEEAVQAGRTIYDIVIKIL